MKKAFTLLELLIVIGIVGTLATITATVLKPGELINSSRDTKRMTELNTLNKAIALYLFNEGSTFGSSSKVYVSLPDTNENCSSYPNLPTPPSPYTYVCKPESTYRNTNGTGWIPINFNSIPTGSPLSSLVTDPQNDDDNGVYFTYTPDPTNKTWELTAKLISSKYEINNRNIKDGGDDDNRYEIGSNLAASSYPPYVYNPLENNVIITGFTDKVLAQTAPSNGQISIFSDATHIYGTNNFFWDNTNSKLSVAGIIESTSGGFKFPDGTTQTTMASSGIGGIQVFESSGTFTVPAGVTKIKVTVVGGGGGGGGGSTQGASPSGGGRGGSGGGWRAGLLSVTPNTTYNVTIGTGGNGGNYGNTTAAQSGSNGGNSSFGSLMTGNGGTGGVSYYNYGNSTAGGESSGEGYGGRGGVSIGNAYQACSYGPFNSGGAASGGDGGGPYGGGGGAISYYNGGVGGKYGGGGGGGGCYSGNGGAGGAGVVVVEW